MKNLILSALVRLKSFSLSLPKKRESGQTTIEYILLIIVALILITFIIYFLKGPLKSMWDQATDALNKAFNDLKSTLGIGD